MATSSPLPLVQQVIAWMLQGMGLLDDLSISRSTAKNALRGKVVWQSWDRLLSDLVQVFNATADPDQVEAFGAAVRDIDRRVSALHDLELPTADRLPAVLRRVIPELGCRLGALAAMIDGGVASGAGEHVPELAEWVTEPLSPRVFGRVLELLLKQHHPEWDSWEKRKDGLAPRGKKGRKVVSRKSIERWRSGQVWVPSTSNVTALASIMGDEGAQRRAAVLLRLGRLLTVAQRDLAVWLDEMAAEDVARALTAWARQSRAALGSPGVLADLAEEWAKVIEAPGGDVALRGLARSIGVQHDTDVEPDQAAAELRAAARIARETDDCEPLRMFQVQALLFGNPVIIGFVGAQLGAPGLMAAQFLDPYQQIQAEWSTVALVKAVAEGTLPSSGLSPDATAARSPSDSLRSLAAKLLADMGRIIKEPGADEASEIEGLRFVFGLFAEMGTDVSDLPDLWNRAVSMMILPSDLELVLEDDVVQGHPHLAVQRALRLMEAGQTKQALEWFRTWTASAGVKPWPERMAAAKALTKWSADQLDQGVRLRDSLYDALDELPKGAPLPEVMERGVATLQRTAENVDRLLGIVERLLTCHPQSLENEQRVVLLLPLAMRFDAFVGELRDEEFIDLTRSGPLAEQAVALNESRPHHGELWAVLAAYQAFLGEDHTFAQRHAEHYGAGSHLSTIMKSLAADGLLDQG